MLTVRTGDVQKYGRLPVFITQVIEVLLVFSFDDEPHLHYARKCFDTDVLLYLLTVIATKYLDHLSIHFLEHTSNYPSSSLQ